MTFKEHNHDFDFCVVGGGIAGLLAAVSAARHGAKTVLVQDRPVLGGNASSEIRMWICGAHGQNNRETGILEELMLENDYRNPKLNFSIWDSILYSLARCEENLTLMLNTSINAATMSDDGSKILCVRGWQLTTQSWHNITAKIFADCSGDSVLAPLSGAKWRMGREASSEYGEDIAPEVSDTYTMGNSCLLQAREYPEPVPFTPPAWARKFHGEEEFPNRHVDWRHTANLWWMELGGTENTIDDAETLRDKLLALAFGVWDYIKNVSPRKEEAANWAVDWVGFLPGKRESRRYVGAHVLTQHDVRSGGCFPDTIAYGGWSMDDHHPMGFETDAPPTIYHPAPSPYGIPFRCCYSANVSNLLFAGRNISTTHTALSSTRVMATCGTLGQAVGTAAALCLRHQCLPADISANHIAELQSLLMDDDCWLPGFKRQVPALSLSAQISAADGTTPAELLDGHDRPIGEEDHGWRGKIGTAITLEFAKPSPVKRVRIICDSDLDRQGVGVQAGRCELNCHSNYPLHQPDRQLPGTLLKEFLVEGKGADGNWRQLEQVTNNYQRLINVDMPGDEEFSALRLTPLATWGGGEDIHLFAFDAR